MRDFPFTEQLRALLERDDVQAWLVGSVIHGAGPAQDYFGELIFRFDDDDEGARFEAVWLGTDQPPDSSEKEGPLSSKSGRSLRAAHEPSPSNARHQFRSA